MRLAIDRLDHLVLTCADLEGTAAWYERVLGLRRETFGNHRTALHFGKQKINLHQQGREVSRTRRRRRPAPPICASSPRRRSTTWWRICGPATLRSNMGRRRRAVRSDR